jgi:hypothetical protein
MKSLVILLVIVVANAVTCFAQKAEKFDIATFTTPKGWQKEVSENAVQFGAENTNGGICLVTLFKSVPGSDDSRVNFDASWDTIVKELVTVNGKPQMNDPAVENGWTAQSGIAAYESEGKKGLAMLVTLTGGSKLVNILILTNTQDFQDSITAFLESIVLPKVTAQTPCGQAGNGTINSCAAQQFQIHNYKL